MMKLKKSKFKKLFAILTLVSMVTLTACGGSGGDTATNEGGDGEDTWDKGDYTWKVTTVEYPSYSVANTYASYFKEYVEDVSDGHIQVECYPGGALGSGPDLTELVLNGTIQWYIADPAQVYPFYPEIGILNLQYLFPADWDEFLEFVNNSDAMDLLTNNLYDAGIDVWAWTTEGTYYVHSNKELKTPKDFQGVRFRTQSSEIEMANFQAYSANTAWIAFSEVYTALQLGTVDAGQQPTTGIYNMKFFEVQDYALKTYAQQYFMFPISSTNFTEGLPDDIRAIAEDGWAYATEKGTEYAIDRAEYGWDVLSTDECGMTCYELTEEEQDAFRPMAETVWDQYPDIVGGSDAAYELLEAFRSEMGQ